ncbi:MAG: efflux RND transporter periplasmic adaptor subunit [Planctomycetota bacterium]
MKSSHVFLLLIVLASYAIPGCRETPGLTPSTGPVTVSVAMPIERDVVDHAQFTGRLNAVDQVEIRSRVTGYLMDTRFKEGSVVKAGQVLCEIDPRTYQAQLDAAKGALEAAEAKYQLARTENDRAKSLYAENPQAISKKALDQHQAEEDSAAADVVASRSSMEVYQLNREFCEITSPIDGRVGRYQVTKGNLVTQNSTTLTTVVSQDPIYGYCSIDELTLLKVLNNLFDGKMPPLSSRKITIGMGLQNEQGFPHQGTADFADNELNSSTGTLTIRAVFPNPANAKGVRLFIPGMYVRMRVPLDLPHPAVLIAEQAVGTDQGQKFVYVLDGDNKVEYRKVALGPLQDDGLRVIRQGVEPGDRVVVNGIQLIQSGDTVKSETVPMHDPNQQPKTAAPLHRDPTPADSSTRADGTTAGPSDRGQR